MSAAILTEGNRIEATQGCIQWPIQPLEITEELSCSMGVYASGCVWDYVGAIEDKQQCTYKWGYETMVMWSPAPLYGRPFLSHSPRLNGKLTRAHVCPSHIESILCCNGGQCKQVGSNINDLQRMTCPTVTTPGRAKLVQRDASKCVRWLRRLVTDLKLIVQSVQIQTAYNVCKWHDFCPDRSTSGQCVSV